jgi:tetratricopeptide (TPR) repeat protein
MKKLPWTSSVAFFAIAAIISGCSAQKPSQADLDAYLKARDLYLRGAVEEAASAVSLIESRTGAFHQARLLEGKILFFQGKMPEAERVFRQLSSRFPGYTEAQLWMLRAFQAQGKKKEAEVLLSEVLEKNPGDPRFLHQAGILRLATDDITGALGFFRRSQEYATELSQSYVETARIQYRFGMIDPALSDLARAQALLPPDSSVRRSLIDLEKRIREDKQ